jgi:hypothetical protein
MSTLSDWAVLVCSTIPVVRATALDKSVFIFQFPATRNRRPIAAHVPTPVQTAESPREYVSITTRTTTVAIISVADAPAAPNLGAL